MRDYDPADLDGDGEFDAIDIVILEEGKGKQRAAPDSGNNGCCFSLLFIGLLSGGAILGVKLMTV